MTFIWQTRDLKEETDGVTFTNENLKEAQVYLVQTTQFLIHLRGEQDSKRLWTLLLSQYTVSYDQSRFEFQTAASIYIANIYIKQRITVFVHPALQLASITKIKLNCNLCISIWARIMPLYDVEWGTRNRFLFLKTWQIIKDFLLL